MKKLRDYERGIAGDGGGGLQIARLLTLLVCTAAVLDFGYNAPQKDRNPSLGYFYSESRIEKRPSDR